MTDRQIRPNNRTLPPPRRDPLTGKWFTTLPDSDQRDIIMLEVTLRHIDGRAEDSITGRELQRAGALYQYMDSNSEYKIAFNPDDSIAEIVGRLAEDATNLLLDWRRENHEHTRISVSRLE